MKSENCPVLLNHKEYFAEVLHTHCYRQDLAKGVAKCHLCHRSRLCRGPDSDKNVKLALSLEYTRI